MNPRDLRIKKQKLKDLQRERDALHRQHVCFIQEGIYRQRAHADCVAHVAQWLHHNNSSWEVWDQHLTSKRNLPQYISDLERDIVRGMRRGGLCSVWNDYRLDMWLDEEVPQVREYRINLQLPVWLSVICVLIAFSVLLFKRLA